jgi:hypothetical protein
MRRTGAILAGLGLALLTGGCDTTDLRFFRYGVGTDLYSSDIVETTQYQDLYLTELCRQALPVLSRAASAECANAALLPNDWTLIVQAGLNDIDRRCDTYLAWLDDRRRTNASILKQLGDTTVATQGIMRLVGVGADPITIAGLAFGFATNTFTNINSRLLLEVDKTTVQTLVLRRRSEFRLDAALGNVNNRPAAIHALRLYLTICTPFAIETDINTTVTVFQQTGPGGLGAKPPLVSPVTIAPLRSGTFTDTPPVRGGTTPPERIAAFEAIIVNYNPKVDTPRFVRGLMGKLCLKESDAEIVPRTMAAIQVFQQLLIEAKQPGVTITGKLSPQELLKLNDISALTSDRKAKCDTNRFRNIYEASTVWPGGIANPATIPLVNRALPPERRMCATVSEKTVRARIADVRLSLVSKLTLRSIELVEQLTSDLTAVLFDMPTVPEVACSSAAPPPVNAPDNATAPAPTNGARTTTTIIPVNPAPATKK